jgi:hypothetical protein
MIVRRKTWLSYSLVIVTALALNMAATCNHGKPKADTVLNIKLLTVSVGALQRGETALFNAKTIPALTLLRHNAFNGKVVEVVDAITAAVDACDAWRPGQPIPPQLGEIMTKIKVLLDTSSDVIGVALPKEYLAVWDALTQVAFITGGLV